MTTYFDILLIFILPPIVVLSILTKYRINEIRKIFFDPLKVLVLLSLVALIYTTPWDNYLVKEGIWYYDESLISGIIIFYVPLEEYLFFVLETIFVGLFLINFNLKQHNFESSKYNKTKLKAITIPLSIIFILSTALLFLGSDEFTYLTLILVWALIPLGIQLVFGLDIIWQKKSSVFPTIILTTIYLSLVDAFAIISGVWTISSNYSISNFTVGILPLEEITFFAMTTTMVTFGLTLLTNVHARSRFKALLQRFQERDSPISKSAWYNFL